MNARICFSGVIMSIRSFFLYACKNLQNLYKSIIKPFNKKILVISENFARHNQKTIVQLVSKKFKIIIPRDNTLEVDSSQCFFQQYIQ